MQSDEFCLCGSKKTYDQCCQPFHYKKNFPETPELLLRSRYSAYALALADYIVDTTDPTGPVYEPNIEHWKSSIIEFSKSVLFQGVEVLSENSDQEKGEITFIAHLTQQGRNVSFRETSQFTKHKGKWVYRQGVVDSL